MRSEINGLEFYRSGLFEFHCFLGGGGGALGSILDRRRIIGAIEKEPYRRALIYARQKDKILPWFPIWDNIETFGNGNPETREMVDQLRKIRDRLVISGGFPCQDISPVGKRRGIHGRKSGLFFELARIVSEIGSAFWFMENSTDITYRGFDEVLWKVAQMGYNARWAELGAYNAGAPHERKRLWILAYPNKKRLQENRSAWRHEEKKPLSTSCDKITLWDKDPAEQKTNESKLGRMAHGIPYRVDRVKTIGDGQVPSVVSIAWRILSEGLI